MEAHRVSKVERVRRPHNLAPELRPVLDAVDQALAANQHVLNGILTEEYEYKGAAIAKIKTGLTRPLRGWLPVRIRANTYVVFYEDLGTDLGAMADSHMAIACNAACVVQFLVW